MLLPRIIIINIACKRYSDLALARIHTQSASPEDENDQPLHIPRHPFTQCRMINNKLLKPRDLRGGGADDGDGDAGGGGNMATGTSYWRCGVHSWASPPSGVGTAC